MLCAVQVCRVQWQWQGCHHSRSSCVHQQGATTITVVAVHQIWQHAAICIGQLRRCTSLVASYVCSQQLQGKAGCAFKAVHPVNTLSTLCRHNPTEQHLARNVRLHAAVVGPWLLALWLAGGSCAHVYGWRLTWRQHLERHSSEPMCMFYDNACVRVVMSCGASAPRSDCVLYRCTRDVISHQGQRVCNGMSYIMACHITCSGCPRGGDLRRKGKCRCCRSRIDRKLRAIYDRARSGEAESGDIEHSTMYAVSR